jgi:hypothetical protein
MKVINNTIAVAAVLGCLAAGPSLAGPIGPGASVNVDNRAGSVFTPSPIAGDANGLYTNVTITVNGSNVGVSAGMFVLDYRDANDPSAPWEQFLSFCLSPDVWLMPFDNPYTVHSLSASPYSAKADLIAEFWGRYRGSITNDVTAAAFQVGLWELAFDSGADLNAGSFRLATSEDVLNTAQYWLSSLDGTGPRASGLIVLVDKAGGYDRQDLITQIPEPGTLALIGFGLAGLGLARRRARAAK